MVKTLADVYGLNEDDAASEIATTTRSTVIATADDNITTPSTTNTSVTVTTDPTTNSAISTATIIAINDNMTSSDGSPSWEDVDNTDMTEQERLLWCARNNDTENLDKILKQSSDKAILLNSKGTNTDF